MNSNKQIGDYNMINDNTVSVIIPVYNASSTLHACIDSLLGQTYENLELIFVDDCSTDDSLRILSHVVEWNRNSNIVIKILPHECNRGVAAARNTALACATGEYIYYVDADDSVEPDTIERLVRKALEKDADIVGHEWYLSSATGIRYMPQPDYTTPLQALQQMMCGRMRWTLWLFMVRRSLYVEHDIHFLEGMNIGEDMLVVMKLFMCAQKVAIIHRPFYYYRLVNPSSLTKSYVQDHFRQVSENVYEVERSVRSSPYAGALSGFIPFLKLSVKLPLLISDDISRYARWLEWFPEANEYAMRNKALPLRTRLVQWLAAKRCFTLLRWHYVLLYKLAYRIIYH